MTLPHKRLELGGKVYFVATFPEGDLSIHEWTPSYQQGYGGSRVTFLLESDGDEPIYETVKGPFSCNDMFDHGRAKMLRERFGLEAKPVAFLLRVGRGLCSYSSTPRDIQQEEPVLSCGPIGPRIQALLDAGASMEAEWEIKFRGGSRFLAPDEVAEYLPKTESA
jgi:hypothetical protein